jgi:hypothetical protein
MSSTTSSSPLAYLSQLLTGSSKSSSSSVLNRLIGGNTDKSTNSIASAINNAINAGKKPADLSSSTVSNLNLSASVLSLLQGQSESGSGSDLISQIFSSPKESSVESNILAATIAKQILKSAVNGTNQRQALAAQTGGVQSAIDAYNKQFNAPAATTKKITTA